MNRKPILACVTLAAFAALAVGAAPASAANDPQLTTSTGKLVQPGTTDIKLTQVGSTAMITTSGTTLLQCTTGVGAGEVVKNSGGTVEGEITSLTIGGTGAKAAGEPANECTASFGNISITPILPWCLRSTPTMAEDEAQASGGKCPSEGSVKFIMAGTATGECEYETTGPIKGDFTTQPSDAQATVRSTQTGSGIQKIKGGFLCPSSVMLNGTRTAEDEAGNPLFVS